MRIMWDPEKLSLSVLQMPLSLKSSTITENNNIRQEKYINFYNDKATLQSFIANNRSKHLTSVWSIAWTTK